MRESSEPALPLARAALIPASLVLCFGLYVGARWPAGAVLAAAAPWLALFLGAPAWADASARAFDRDALALRIAGRGAEVVGRLRSAWGLRWFGLPAEAAMRLGEACQDGRDHAGARTAFRAALRASGATPHVRVLLGLGHAAFALEDDTEAIAAYQRLVEADLALPRVEPRLVRALLRRDGEGDRAEAVARLAAMPDATDFRAERRLLDALGAVRDGRRSDARAALGASRGEVDAEAEELSGLRREIEALLSDERGRPARSGRGRPGVPSGAKR